jgi:sensor histidine kinase YesM
MTIKNIILKRSPIILITSIGIGLLILTPVVLSTNTTFNRYFSVFLLFFLLGLIGWITNIVFTVFFIQSLKSYLWKWLASTIFLILCTYLSHLIFKNLFIIKTPNFGYFRVLGVICFNTAVFTINMLINSFESKLQLEDENNQLKINRLQAELSNLKNQINPHFLFNALASLKSLMRVNPQIAESYLMKLSEFLRASISQTTDSISLQDELLLCKDYIDLQKIRFQEGLIYETEIDPNSLHYKIPFFALQSLIENSLKHNIVSLMNPLTIRVEVTGDQLTIVNNIQALLTEVASSNTGLHNLNERMKIQSGQPIIIDKNQHYFKVQLTLILTSVNSPH